MRMEITSDALVKEPQVNENHSRSPSIDLEHNMRKSQSDVVASIHIPSSVYWLRFLDSRRYTHLFVVSPKKTPENTSRQLSNYTDNRS